MWALRVLNGPMAGQVFPLKNGQNIIGRGADCDIILQLAGISKQHAQVEVIGNKIILTDLNSRNGTSVNGVRTQTQRLHLGDKVSAYNILLDLIQAPTQVQRPQGLPQSAPWPRGPATVGAATSPSGSLHDFSVAPGMGPAPDPTSTAFVGDKYASGQVSPSESPSAQFPSSQQLTTYVTHYIENVAMPGVYSLAKLVTVRTLIGLFVGFTVLATSALSSLLTVQVSRDSIVTEAKRRTASLAVMLHEGNRAAIVSDQENSLDTTRVGKEEGVKEALIVGVDGQILAPPRRVGEYSKESFVASAIRADRQVTERIDGGKVGSTVPIYYYDQSLGKQIVKAYAVVIYELDALAAGDGQFILLFVKTLLLAALSGALFAFLIMRLTERPIEDLNQQVDKILRDGEGQTTTDIRFPQIQVLINNINSALARVHSAGTGGRDQSDVVVDRDAESQNLVQLIGLPAMVIDGSDETIRFMNRAFEDLTGVRFASVQRQTVGSIPDQSLRLNLQELIVRAQQQAHIIASSSLEFSGEMYDLHVQSVFGGRGVAYYLVLIQLPADAALGQAGGY